MAELKSHFRRTTVFDNTLQLRPYSTTTAGRIAGQILVMMHLVVMVVVVMMSVDVYDRREEDGESIIVFTLKPLRFTKLLEATTPTFTHCHKFLSAGKRKTPQHF